MAYGDDSPHAIAMRVLEQSTNTDPALLAEEFMALVEPGSERAVLSRLARPYMVKVLGQNRRKDLEASGEAVRRDKLESSAKGTQLATAKTPSRAPLPSSASLVMERWSGLMKEREFVPGSSGGTWIRRGDANLMQVSAMSKARLSTAHAHMARAKAYHRVAQLMEREGALKVSDLERADFLDAFLADPDSERAPELPAPPPPRGLTP